MIEFRWKPEGEDLTGSVQVAGGFFMKLQYRELQGEEWSEWQDVPIGGG